MQEQKKWTVGWGVTSRCDLACSFCYSKQNRVLDNSEDVALSDAEMFCANNRNSISSINFGTGESFLMPCFHELLQICRSILGVPIAVTTNGAIADYLDNNKLIKAYANLINELDISIDFANPKKHSESRGHHNAWERAICALELGQTLGYKLSIVMVGTPHTISADNIRQMSTIANHYKAALRINIYMPTTGNFSFALDYEEVIELMSLLMSNSRLIRTSDPLFSILLGNSNGNGSNGLHSLRILPNSSLSPSTYLLNHPWAMPVKIDQLILSEVDGYSNMRNWQSLPLPIKCNQCNYKSYCRGGSRERRILWESSLKNTDPYCPVACGETIEDVRSRIPHSKTGNWAGPSIHLSYLPTIVSIPLDKNIEKSKKPPNLILLKNSGECLMKKNGLDMQLPTQKDTQLNDLKNNKWQHQWWPEYEGGKVLLRSIKYMLDGNISNIDSAKYCWVDYQKLKKHHKQYYRIAYILFKKKHKHDIGDIHV